MFIETIYSSELYHHGVKGMKWGVRRYQNEDGSLTEEGKKKYDEDSKILEEFVTLKERVKSDKKSGNDFAKSLGEMNDFMDKYEGSRYYLDELNNTDIKTGKSYVSYMLMNYNTGLYLESEPIARSWR